MFFQKILMNFRENSNIQLILNVYQILDLKSKRRIKAIIPIYVCLSVLDLVGVILLASCGTIAFNLVSGDSRPSRVELILSKFIAPNLERELLILIFAITAALFLILKTLLNALVSYRMIGWFAHQESTFSTSLFSSLLRAPLSEMRRIQVGDAQWAIMIGSTRIISGVVSPLITALGDMISILVLITTLIIANPEITVLLVLLLVLSRRLYAYLIRGRINSYGKEASEKGAALNDEIIQSFNAVKEIKIYSLTESINQYFARERNVISIVGQKSSFLNSLFRYYLETIILFSTFFVVVFELYTSDLRRALTSLVLFMSVGLRIIPSLQRLQAITMSLQLSNGMTKTFFDLSKLLHGLDQDNGSNVDKKWLSRANVLGINISKLEYSYSDLPGEPSILKGIDLKLNPGTLTAIVGASGSGKTTLIDLMSGLLETKRGSISFFDVDDCDFLANRELVGYCSQHPYIFDSDIEENLRIARADVMPREIKSIISELNLDSLTLDSISESDVPFSRRISGGERQRIGIARTFLSNRPILVFDEPTSALDKENTVNFVKLLHQYRGLRTQIVVTHDFALAQKCDLLVVIDQGFISYAGNPLDYIANQN